MSQSRSSSRPRVEPLEAEAEDFLFHLYRGSEMLADGRYEGAHEELARALRAQPHDAAAQDLLAKVYFKLGLYPRAIELYLDIVRQFPDRIPPRINLALAYLKTGQMRDTVNQLLPVIEREPEHTRAWGYLGLAWSRLAEYAKAREAFARAGHDGMARRMDEALEAQYAPPNRASTVPPVETIESAVPSAISITTPVVPPPPNTPNIPQGIPVSIADVNKALIDGAPLPRSASDSWMPPPEHGADLVSPLHPAAFHSLEDLARDQPLAPRGDVLEIDEGALVVVGGCAARLGSEAIEVGIERGEFVRRRGIDNGAFAGGLPLIWLRSGWAVIPAEEGRSRLVVPLRDEGIFVREEWLAAFEGALLYDNAVVGEPPRQMFAVLLRGMGRLVLNAPGTLRSIPARANAPVSLPMDALVAWSSTVTATVASLPRLGVMRMELRGDGVVIASLPERGVRPMEP